MPESISGKDAITLVIGQSEGDGAVCEGFAIDQIRAAIDQIHPVRVVGVGALPISELLSSISCHLCYQRIRPRLQKAIPRLCV